MQSVSGHMEVVVVNPTPWEVLGHDGEHFRARDHMVYTGSHATLLLSVGSQMESAVQLCGWGTYVRALKEESDEDGHHGWQTGCNCFQECGCRGPCNADHKWEDSDESESE